MANLWDDWKKKQEERYGNLPTRVRYMHAYNGRKEGEKCGCCKHFLYSKNRNIRTCAIQNINQWNSEFPACGLFEQTQEE